MAVLAVSYRLRDTMAILIVGLMFGSLTSAMGTLTYFSTAEQLQKFTFGPWESGNLSDIHWILFLCVLVGLFLSLFSIKPLNALLLGKLCRSLGLNYKRTRLIIMPFWQGELLLRLIALIGPCGSSYCKIGFSDQ
jgi:iron complex transport system permease protein